MALLLIMQGAQIYQTGIWDLGEIASVIGVLLLLRALLASPALISTPPGQWFNSGINLTTATYKYLMIGLGLIIVGLV